MKLKEQLSEAMKEIQRLSVSSSSSPSLSTSDGGVLSNSPISSSISDMGQAFLGEFASLDAAAAAGYNEDVFYSAIPDESNYIQSLEWFNQCL